MIPQSEVRSTAELLGVPEFQIVRDHVVSHVLDALKSFPGAEVIFFGGTALCRTWCPGLRLSEDIDLITANYPFSSQEILRHVQSTKRSEFPDLQWSPFDNHNDTQTTVITTSSSQIKMQFVKPRPAESVIPIESAPVQLKYSDLPQSVDLEVPTAEGFAAMKLMAWHQRQACRDLYDLAALADIGALTDHAVNLTHEVTHSRIGFSALNHTLIPRVLDSWDTQLSHQMNKPRSAEACLQTVLEALRKIDHVP